MLLGGLAGIIIIAVVISIAFKDEDMSNYKVDENGYIVKKDCADGNYDTAKTTPEKKHEQSL